MPVPAAQTARRRPLPALMALEAWLLLIGAGFFLLRR
jgi:hypothetical protein